MELLNVTVGTSFRLKSPKGRFGIEIELEGRGLPGPDDWDDEKSVWYPKPDGSLRNGMEYVSKPTNYPRDAVHSLAETLAKHGAVINNTYRCSTHIHYNFIDRTWGQVIGTVIAWNIIEPLVFRQMPPGRDGSIFCMSAYDTGDLPLRFGTFCDEMKKKFMSVGFDEVCRQKYASINLTRLRDLGTIEFRVFPPTVDGVLVKKWCVWLDNLVGLVEKTTPENFGKFIKAAEDRPVDFVRSVFGELPVPEVEVGNWVDLGCKTAYELVRTFNASMKKKSRGAKEKEEAEPAVAAAGLGEIRPGIPAAGWMDDVRVAAVDMDGEF